MARMAVLMAALAALVAWGADAAPAGESADPAATLQQLAQRGREPADGMPKGSYRDSCQCQISGGVTLLCFCANINARMFQTQMDVRTCQPPKDIKNCDGRLKCVDTGGAC